MLARNLLLAVDNYRIVPRALDIEVIPAHFVEKILVVVALGHFADERVSHPGQVDGPGIEVSMVRVVGQSAFRRHLHTAVRKIAAHKSPVDAGKIFRSLAGLHGRDIGRTRPDQFPHIFSAVISVQIGLEVVHRGRILRLFYQFIIMVRRSDRAGRLAIVETAGQSEQREIGRMLQSFGVEQVDLPARHLFNRIHEIDRLPQSVPGIPTALAPAVVGTQMRKHPGDPFATAGQYIDQARLFGQQRQGRHTHTRMTDPRPVAFIGRRPPLVLVVPPDARDRLFEQGTADTVTLRFGERRVEPVVNQAHDIGAVGYGNIVRERYLIVGDPVRPHPRIDDFEIVCALHPGIHRAKLVDEIERPVGIRLLPGHLVQECEVVGSVQVEHLVIEVGIGLGVTRRRIVDRQLRLDGRQHRTLPVMLEQRHHFGSKRIGPDPFKNLFLALVGKDQVGMLQLLL